MAVTYDVPKVGFFEAVKLYFANYANFRDRSRRSEYWWVTLFNFLVNLLIALLVPGLAIVYSLVTLIPSMALCVRRLHDVGKSGWWYLIGAVPLVGYILLIVWFCTDSKEANQWGPNPKDIGRASSPVPEAKMWDIGKEELPRTAPAAIPQPVMPKTEPAVPLRNVSQKTIALQIHSGPMAGTSFKKTPGQSAVIGRDPARCDIVLSQYKNVSGVHCQIRCYEDRITITDMNSTNGTFVNGSRVMPNSPVSVRDGSTVCLANANCTIRVNIR